MLQSVLAVSASALSLDCALTAEPQERVLFRGEKRHTIYKHASLEARPWKWGAHPGRSEQSGLVQCVWACLPPLGQIKLAIVSTLFDDRSWSSLSSDEGRVCSLAGHEQGAPEHAGGRRPRAPSQIWVRTTQLQR
eukprot:6205143-Pleurochrysis_carterae.AAC.2